MLSDAVYLDHNGTTPILPAVAEAMWPYLSEHHGNPSSDSAAGRKARAAVEEARAHLAALIGGAPEEITFTSGGTEANNLAIRGGVAAAVADRPAAALHLATSRVEHPATREPIAHLERRGARVHRLEVDAEGRIDPEKVPGNETFGPNSILLGSLILGQNETGTIQPLTEFARHIHAAGGIVHTDAAQAVGKIPLDVGSLGVDLMSVAGHKFYAPKGVGALYVRGGTPIAPLVRGAGQERGLRPGTENVASIVGLGEGARLAALALADGEDSRQCDLRERLWSRLKTDRRFLRVTAENGTLPNTLMISVPGQLGREVLARCPEIEASTGSACHAGIDAPAETLLAMGLSPDVALGAIRLSLGRSTSAADVDRAADALLTAVR